MPLIHAEAEWPMTRGCATQAGIYEGGLPTNLTMDWEVDIDGRIAGNVAFVGALVVMPVQLDGGTFLHGWDRETGELIHVFNESTVLGGAVATASRILASGPDDAWVSWGHDGSDFRRFALPARAMGSPVVFGNSAFFSIADGIIKIDVDSGQAQWSQKSVRGAMFLTPEQVVVSNEDGLVALDHEGTVRWTYDADEIRGVAVGNGSVFFMSNRWSLTAISLTTGEREWTLDFLLSARSATPVYAGGMVLLHGFDDSLRAFDGTNGTETWSTRPQEEAVASVSPAGGQTQDHNVPVAADGHRLAFSRHAGGLELRNLATGELLESHDLEQASARHNGPVAAGHQIAVPLSNSIAVFSGDPNPGSDCNSQLANPRTTSDPPTDIPSDVPGWEAPFPIVWSITAIAVATGMHYLKRRT